MAKKVLIIGAGDGGRLILSMLKKYYKDLVPIGFLDDNPDLLGKNINGLKVIGGLGQAKRLRICAALMGIGCSNMHARELAFDKIKKAGLKVLNLIHPAAIIDSSVSLGEGVIIFAGVVINPFVSIKDNVIIFPGVTIDHDCLIKSHVYISPGVNIAGHVTIKQRTFIGIGAKIIDQINVGRNATIGAGAVVLNNVPDNVVCAGVPARILKTRKVNR